jgi:hypothetical protein
VNQKTVSETFRNQRRQDFERLLSQHGLDPDRYWWSGRVERIIPIEPQSGCGFPYRNERDVQIEMLHLGYLNVLE